MNPRSFMIVFTVILCMVLIAGTSDLERSYFVVSTKYDVVLETELQSAECERTKILMENILRQSQEYSFKVTCTPIDK